MPSRATDQVAIVTGASRGIGRGIAIGLGEAGWTVYLTGRTLRDGDSDRPGSIAKTADEVTRAGGSGIAAPCDHSLDSDTAALFDRVITEHGRLNLLVNNATSYTTDVGPPPGGPFWEEPIEVWDLMQQVGLRSHYVAGVFAARIMVRQRGGLIVNVSSAGAAAPGRNVAYNVVKAGVDMMTRGMAKQLVDHGVAVISVWPRLTRTEGVMAHPEMFGDLSKAWSPEFNGRAVAALASDPRVIEKTGRAIDVGDLAEAYGFTDFDGRRPVPLPRPS